MSKTYDWEWLDKERVFRLNLISEGLLLFVQQIPKEPGWGFTIWAASGSPMVCIAGQSSSIWSAFQAADEAEDWLETYLKNRKGR